MQLSKIGKYFEEQIRNVSEHYPYAEIPLWVIMPDHNSFDCKYRIRWDDVHIVPAETNVSK